MDLRAKVQDRLAAVTDDGLYVAYCWLLGAFVCPHCDCWTTPVPLGAVDRRRRGWYLQRAYHERAHGPPR